MSEVVYQARPYIVPHTAVGGVARVVCYYFRVIQHFVQLSLITSKLCLLIVSWKAIIFEYNGSIAYLGMR